MKAEEIDLKKLERMLFDLLKRAPNDRTLHEVHGTIKKLEEEFAILPQEEVQKLRELREPPLDYAIYLEPSQHDPNALVIGFRGTVLEARLQPDAKINAAALVPGQQVVLNGRRNIVAIRDVYMSGEVAEVINVRMPPGTGEIVEVESYPPYPGRVRLQGGKEINVLCLPTLMRAETPLKSGDVVRVDYERSATPMAVEKVKPSLHVRSGSAEGMIMNITRRLMDEGVQVGNLVRIDSSLKWAFEKVISPTTGKLSLEEIPDVSYEDIGGLEDQIEDIRYAIELPYYREVVDYFDLERPKGILLYGPPGCGKTMVAKAIANNLTRVIKRHLSMMQKRINMLKDLRKRDPNMKLSIEQLKRYIEIMPMVPPREFAVSTAVGQLEQNLRLYNINMNRLDDELQKIENEKGTARAFFKNVKGPELLSKWLGETERQVREIFEEARKQASVYKPVVIFFDEIESLFRRRGSGLETHVEATTVPQFLAEMDGVESTKNVIIIGASNREDMIDPAFMRPGRFDVKIKIDRPDQAAAMQILARSLLPMLPIDFRKASTAPGIGNVVFSTAYLRLEKLKPDIAAVAKHLPQGCDVRLAFSIEQHDLDRLAKFPPVLSIAQALDPQFNGGLSPTLHVTLTYLRKEQQIGDVVTQLRTLRATFPVNEGIIQQYIQREWAAETLIRNITLLLYHQSSVLGMQAESEYLMFPLRDFMNGAILTSIVTRAKRDASKRALLANADRRQWSITWDDIKASIMQEFLENKEQMIQYKVRHELKKQNVPIQGVELSLPQDDRMTNPWIESKFRPYAMESKLPGAVVSI